jgi:hypothetical protein
LEALSEREKRAVTPQIRWSGFDIFSREPAANGVHVIGNFEWREALIAERARFVTPQLPTFAALQLKMLGHSRLPAFIENVITAG